VGKTILDVGYRLSQVREEDRAGKVIFVIITEGMENSSREFTYSKVRELIRHQSEKYGWEFVFLGSNIDAVSEADNLGILEYNAYNFAATGEGVREMYCMACEAVEEKRKQS